LRKGDIQRDLTKHDHQRILNCMQPFDSLNISLPGRKLIESSAGTGKTYAIASLYIRLLLERRLSVSQILVVTFTEAATQDLKRRIRERIHEAAKAIESGEGDDDFLAGLLRKISDRKEAQTLLGDALRALDEAAIFTIHGFCQRVLQEYAFESASLFDAEFVTSQQKLLREIVNDFWRKEFYPASSLFILYARDQKYGPEMLYDFVRKGLASPFLTIVPQTLRPSTEVQERAEITLRQAYKELSAAWEVSKTEVSEILLDSSALKRNLYRRDTMIAALQSVDRYLALDNPLTLPRSFDKFLPVNLANAIKQGYSPPRHRFFGLCQDLQQAHKSLIAVFDQALMALRVELNDFARRELRQRKRQQRLRSFDDLLLDVYDALEGPRRDTLAQALRQRYPAALIDEFQDTDPVQYAIFRAIYSDDESTLVLIGDPKQAIYSFRGADVFAYIEAAQEIREQYTLDKNWRSSESLVKAVNAVFQHVQDPFVFPQISFHPVRTAKPETTGEFLWGDQPDPAPLKLWFVERHSEQVDRPITKRKSEEVLPLAVATDIVRLLKGGCDGTALIQGRPVSPEDIAVLVRTNREANLVQEMLRQVRVPCVLYSEESVFASLEAMEVERVLVAIAEPSYQGRVRAALATDLFGLNGNELVKLASDDLAWDDWLKAFTEYRDLWVGQGFMTMVTRLMTREKVRSRLLRFPDGERRLTNLLHCFELLHQGALEHKLGIEGVLKWLAEARRDTEDIPAEERQIRLETDEKAVKVVTIHKSKGLEYSIVYCPFSWNTAGEGSQAAIFHDERQPMRTIQDLGSSAFDENRRRARQEALAENVRLLYVALTRARYRCTIVWGAFTDAGASAMAYLWHRPSILDSSRLVEQLESHFKSLGDDAIRSQLVALVQKSGETAALSAVLPSSPDQVYVPPALEAESLVCRQLSRPIPQDSGIASFSSLVSAKAQAAELPDRDSIWASAEPAESTSPTRAEPVTFFDFPKGTRAGTALHEIFELLEFSMDGSEEHRMLVREKLVEFGFDLLWEEVVSRMFHKVLTIPLHRDNPDFTLSRVQRQHRLHEMEFSFPLGPLTPRKLRAVFSLHRQPEVSDNFVRTLEQLAFLPVRGTMKGFVDLIFQFQDRFYLLDWKSNYLGDHFEDYGLEALRAVMAKEFYVLQYHLYSVALHRYLSQRLPGYRYDTHFGGIFYLFLRGIDPCKGPEFGIYHDLPSEALVRDLSQCLQS
jgi:exodeoxyribonuclease V beta subunit